MKLSSYTMLAAVAVGVSVVLFLGGLDQAAWSMGERPPVQGMPAPDFTLQTLRGESRSLSDYEGKIVLLNFWATWCKPCTKEMPAMEAAYQKLRDQDFVVLAVNELEDEDKVRKHVEQHGHTFPVLLDRDNRVANRYGVYGLPVTVFIDETGRVREYIKGGLLTEDTIHEVVQRIRSREAPRTASPRS